MDFKAPRVLAGVAFLRDRRNKACSFEEFDAAIKAGGFVSDRALIWHIVRSGVATALTIDEVVYFVHSDFAGEAEIDMPFELSGDVSALYSVFGISAPKSIPRTRGISPLGVGNGVIRPRLARNGKE